MANQATTTSASISTLSTPSNPGLALHGNWQYSFPIYTFYLVSIAVIYTLGAVYEIQPFATLTGLYDRLLDGLFRSCHYLSDQIIAFLTAIYDRIFKQPALNTPRMVYCLPNRLNYIASSLDINNVTEPMRVGQLALFIRTSDPAKNVVWLGISNSQVFSPRSRGFYSPPIVDEDPNVMIGSKAYEVAVKQPVKEDYTIDRIEVRPTGRAVGEVVGVCGDNVSVLVKVEDWFVESDVFKMGEWRETAT